MKKHKKYIKKLLKCECCCLKEYVHFLCEIYKLIINKSFVYMNIDQKLQNKSHGPMHYKIGVTWFVYSMDTRYIL